MLLRPEMAEQGKARIISIGVVKKQQFYFAAERKYCRFVVQFHIIGSV
jgi:hypothetical protein